MITIFKRSEFGEHYYLLNKLEMLLVLTLISTILKHICKKQTESFYKKTYIQKNGVKITAQG